MQEIAKKYAEPGDVRDRFGKQKTSSGEDRKIIQTSIEDRRKFSIEIARELKEEI